ncbi:MAG: C-terminal binding protein, partial [Sphaerochaetaceae bacterium]|nr:C-terminal binding protein [Sphaerochaetaceae bacterium]
KKELSKMKTGAILINCSRGKLVDNDALYYALKEGHLSSAALDDIEEEPAKKFNWDPSKNPLFSLNNCFITPHVAYYSEEALIEARKKATNNVKAVLLNKEPLYRVV